MLFYTGTRVSEFVQIRVEDLHLALDPPQVYIANAKGEATDMSQFSRPWRWSCARTWTGGGAGTSLKATAQTNTARDTFNG